VTSPAQDPRPSDPVDDVSIVPGLGPAGPLDMSQDPDRYDPASDVVPAGPLDMSQDPDRYDPASDGVPPRQLDPARDPDRVDRTLPELLGAGAFEDRETSQWVLGLIGVIAFLALVSWLFGSVLSG
jgi:hypothetical protein